MKLIIIFFFILILIVSLAYGVPTISFVSPTPADNDKTANNYTYVNVSVSGNTSFIDWSNSVVGWFRLNSNSTEDHSTHENNGTQYGGVNCSATGKFGGACSFDDVDDYIDCGNGSSLDFGDGDFSVEAWIKIASTDATQTIVGTSNTSGAYDYGWELGVGAMEIVFRVWDDDHDDISIGGPVTAVVIDVWYHTVAIRRGADFELYINGTLLDSTTELSIGTVTPIESLKIGLALSGQAGYFNGTIDEVRIHNRSLSAEEINASYNVNLYSLYHNFTGLSDGTYNYTAYTQDTAGDVNSTETRTITIGDLCAAPSSGNWTLDLDNNCSYSSEIINIDYLTFENSGDMVFTDSTLTIKRLESGLPANSRIILFNSSFAILT